jgi:hypothetical protein
MMFSPVLLSLAVSPAPPTAPPPSAPATLAGQLAQLYEATHGAAWLFNQNWMQGDPCANSWYGVGCMNGKPVASECDCPLEKRAPSVPTTLPLSCFDCALQISSC